MINLVLLFLIATASILQILHNMIFTKHALQNAVKHITVIIFSAFLLRRLSVSQKDSTVTNTQRNASI